MLDNQKIRRETMRWNILGALNLGRPIACYGELILATVRAIFHDATEKELLSELEYLASRDLIKLTKQPTGRYFAELTRWGVDVVEYTVDCEAGIGRPEKYWAG